MGKGVGRGETRTKRATDGNSGKDGDKAEDAGQSEYGAQKI